MSHRDLGAHLAIIVRVFLVMPLLGAGSGQAAAAWCNGFAVNRAAAVGNPQAVLNRGTRIPEVTQLEIDKKTHAASVCAHGGSCYPAGSIALQNCNIDSSPLPDFPGQDAWIYGISRH
jgi:hypothetical protein